MKLEMAIVVSCHAEGCRVRIVGQSSPLDATYATPVYNRIRIRRGDLVVLDLTSDPAQIVWRWRLARVLQPLTRQPAEGYVLAGSTCHAFEARLPRPDMYLHPDDTIWVSGHKEDIAVVGRDAGGEPDEPDRIRQTYFPLIEAHYDSPETSS